MEHEDAEVYRKYATELTRFATTLVGPSGAEDLVATVFARALMTPRWPQIDNRRAYLYRALVNEARTRHRATQRRLKRESTASGPSSGEQSLVDVDVLRALRRLDVRQRAVVWMAYWLDAPSGEIASVLGVSVRTVERELRLAYQHLERELS